jgi:enamine deaminase RidA (YjgF/YER057c/UK114 family)
MARATLTCARTAAVLVATIALPRIASAQGRIRHVQPPGLENNPRYSQVVVVEEGPLIHISGQVAHDAAGKLVGKGDMGAQAKQVFENLKIALAAAGSDFAHVVALNSYLTDMSQMPAYRDVRVQYLADLPHPPASTTIGVSRLVDPEALLEVEAVAVVAASDRSRRPKPKAGKS